jgi:hypothetical protein
VNGSSGLLTSARFLEFILGNFSSPHSKSTSNNTASFEPTFLESVNRIGSQFIPTHYRLQSWSTSCSSLTQSFPWVNISFLDISLVNNIADRIAFLGRQYDYLHSPLTLCATWWGFEEQWQTKERGGDASDGYMECHSSSFSHSLSSPAWSWLDFTSWAVGSR